MNQVGERGSVVVSTRSGCCCQLCGSVSMATDGSKEFQGRLSLTFQHTEKSGKQDAKRLQSAPNHGLDSKGIYTARRKKADPLAKDFNTMFLQTYLYM